MADVESINAKINEKYELSNDAKSVSATNVISEREIPRVRLTDMAKQYVLYTAIATAIVVVYLSLRFYKLGIGKIMFRTAATVIFGELLYIAIVSITRLPINKIIIIAAFAVYIAILTFMNKQYMKELSDDKNA